jgi:ADP-ribose pyrophosphatase
MALKHWKKLSSKKLFENGHWSYYLDDFEIEGRGRGVYHYVHTRGSSMVIPVLPDGSIILVNQYRYLNNKESLEFPCGGVDEGLSVEENAVKELREETGFSSNNIIKAGEFSPYTGASDEMCSVFIARELFPFPLQKDATEEFEIFRKTPAEIDELIEKNIIWDGLTLSAWILSKKYFIK